MWTYSRPVVESSLKTTISHKTGGQPYICTYLRTTRFQISAQNSFTIHVWRLPWCMFRSAQNYVCLWSISTLHVGPDQPDPKRNPNPNPTPTPNSLGGSRSARRWQGQSCHAYMSCIANEFSCTSKNPCTYSYVRVHLRCQPNYQTVKIGLGHIVGGYELPSPKITEEKRSANRCANPKHAAPHLGNAVPTTTPNGNK